MKTEGQSKMGPIGCPETPVINYHSMIRYISEERRSHLHRCGSLKSCCFVIFVPNCTASQPRRRWPSSGLFVWTYLYHCAAIVTTHELAVCS